MIHDWINPNEKIKTKFLYRVSTDGEGIDIFEKHCKKSGKGKEYINKYLAFQIKRY